jgi:hypothetical protein
MRIVPKALAAAALLCLVAHASAVPDTRVYFVSQDLPDTEPGKDRWVFHYTVGVGEGLTVGSRLSVGFNSGIFDNLSIDLIGNKGLLGQVQQPDVSLKLPGFAIVEPLTQLRYGDLFSFDLAFDKRAGASSANQPFSVGIREGDGWAIIQRGTTVQLPAVPEPAAPVLLLSGLVALAMACRKKLRWTQTRWTEESAQ